MTRPTKAEAFRARVRRLREVVPAQYPVTVRRAEPSFETSVAEASLVRSGRKRRFVIVIRPEADFIEATDSLIHEWAHCLAWSDGHPTLTDHDEVWGVCVSKCYRAIFPDA